MDYYAGPRRTSVLFCYMESLKVSGIAYIELFRT